MWKFSFLEKTSSKVDIDVIIQAYIADAKIEPEKLDSAFRAFATR